MATCYWRNGDEATSTPGYDGTMEACSNDTSSTSVCCFAGDYCFSSTLCARQRDLYLYRGACTSSTWDEDACGSICANRGVNTFAGVWRCVEPPIQEDYVYACSPSECNSTLSDAKFRIPPNNIVVNRALSNMLRLNNTNVAIESTNTTATSTSGTVECATAETSEELAAPTTCPGISTGAAIGIGVGPSLALLLALAVVSGLLYRERKHSRRGKHTGPPAFDGRGLRDQCSGATYAEAKSNGYSQPQKHLAEAPFMNSVSELPVRRH